MAKKDRKKARERRRRELERTRRALREKAAASPPPPEEEPEEEPLVADEPVQDEDALWETFSEADLMEKQSLFLTALEAGQLDAEYAFEMLAEIRGGLDRRDPQARSRYAELVGRLRDQAPRLYRQDAGYYNQNLISDAIADGRWEDIPALLAPFAERPVHTIDTFFQVIDQLSYHGQVRPLIDTMAQAWPKVSESDELLPGAINEFGGELMHLHLFDYLETAPAPRADDPALLEATAPYGEWNEEWLVRYIPHATAPSPSDWQPADFGPAVDADRWHKNLHTLLLEFVADRHRAGVPYARGHMACGQLGEVLEQQFTSSARPKGKKRVKPRPGAISSSLVPRFAVIDVALGDLFSFLGPQPYKAAAALELLPTYLHFLARLGLIHPTKLDAALVDLRPLQEVAPRAIENYGADPHAVDAVAVAWSEQTLTALREDPALAEARAAPPAPPPPEPDRPARRPGALLTYTFKVTYLYDPEVWRTIEIAEGQSLHDLHWAIQDAVDFDADHLYSFFMSGRAWDQSSEYAHPYADGASAAKVKIGDLNLRMKQRFLYLFDYGDQHRFDVQLVGANPEAPQGDYPRVVERHGEDPVQYPMWDEEDW